MREIKVDLPDTAFGVPGTIIAQNLHECFILTEEMVHLAKSEAKQIIDAAEHRAYMLIDSAQDKINIEMENARERGYKNGEYNCIQKFLNLHFQNRDELEKNVDFCKNIIVDVLNRILLNDLRKEYLTSSVERALSYVSLEKVISITMREEDIKIISDYIDRLKGRGLNFKIDDTLKLGSCILATSDGQVDASLDVLISTLSDTLRANFVNNFENDEPDMAPEEFEDTIFDDGEGSNLDDAD